MGFSTAQELVMNRGSMKSIGRPGAVEQQQPKHTRTIHGSSQPPRADGGRYHLASSHHMWVERRAVVLDFQVEQLMPEHSSEWSSACVSDASC
jgi:hypothetical protein